MQNENGYYSVFHKNKVESLYRMIARAIVSPSKEITSLKKTFCNLSGSTISKLKELHSEVFLNVIYFGQTLGVLEICRGSGVDGGGMRTIICCYSSHFTSDLRAVI